MQLLNCRKPHSFDFLPTQCYTLDIREINHYAIQRIFEKE